MRLLWYPDGTKSPWRSWYERQNDAVRAKHDVTIRFLEAGHWEGTHFRQLSGYDDLQEIKITKGVAHRLVGYYDVNVNVFVVAFPCTHKDERYYPNDALDTAERRAKEIKEGTISVVSCEQPKPLPKAKAKPKSKGKSTKRK